MQTTNFLPGMNPFLQVRWPDAHTRLIAYISDVLNERLPNDLTVVAEESIAIDGSELDSDDVSTTVRWLEIRGLDDRLITIIELLSPSNKTPVGAANMSRRNARLIRNGVNVVEIDLIRGGFRTVPELIAAEMNDATDQTTYLVVVGKACVPEERDVYYCPLRERLPAFAVPLRSTDTPVPLDLQPLVDRCYQAGRYWQVSQRPLPPPALPAEEQAWLMQQLRAADLIDSEM